ncbi:glutaconyl-CoA decarboxylase subunit beta [Verrucomicrobia bacterium IMCC26134]|jgi:oxaloacetate decarboxylase beta subunit|nr:glutaconyl-CoA decarboxylase subunit beta [Verrucomicrobia bacterium IMCC26134]
MIDAIYSGLQGLAEGIRHLDAYCLVMLAIAGGLFYLAVAKGVEPLLLLPIGFGCLLANLPLSELMHPGGVLKTMYDFGIGNELFPLLIFVGIGSMTDFTPLLANPKLLLFGAAGQLGIFCTLLLALALGFSRESAVAVATIGACDGPTVIYVSNLFVGLGKIDTSMVGALAVAAYSYMALVPIIQPPIMRLLTTQKERAVQMPSSGGKVSKAALIAFPLVVTVLTGIIAPKGLPLMGMIMLGNFMKVSGVVPRLANAGENEIANIATLFLGLAIGGTMAGRDFLTVKTLLVFGLGLFAIVIDTVGGVLLGKLWYVLSGGKMNPLIGAAGISAYPMAARLVQTEGQRWNKQNFLLMHAMGANTGGQIGSVMAAAIMLSVLKGLGLI